MSISRRNEEYKPVKLFIESMKYITNTTDFYIDEPTVLSLGKFDGIHRGHELLMEHLAKKKEEGLSAVIFTFNIPSETGHPSGGSKGADYQ